MAGVPANRPRSLSVEHARRLLPADPLRLISTGCDTMVNYFEQLWAEVLAWATTMSMNDWLVVAGIVVAVGFVAMRGMGSRTDY